MLNKNIKRKKSQANVVEFIILMTISLLVIYEFYTLVNNFKYFYISQIYSKTSNIIANFVINNYYDKLFLKQATKAKNITFYIRLPKQIFPGSYYITTKEVNINNENLKFLTIYSTGGTINTFVLSYKLKHNFSYGPGLNKDVVDD